MTNIICKKYFILVILLLSLINLQSNELKKVSLQLMWLDQFEFAGFYIAKEKGYYKNAGLNVELKKFTSSTNVLDTVLRGDADFGTSSTSLLIASSEDKDILLLGSVFQSSPLILLTLKDSKINDLQDFKDKKIMITREQISFATLQTMLASKNMNIDDLKVLEHTYNVDDLINGNTDLMLAYMTNEPYILKEKGYESKIFNPKDYGFDFYEELIFTTNKFKNKNPQLVNEFYEASMKGWKYAFENIEETATLIFNKYNSQNKSLNSLIYEGEQMKKLSLVDGIELGSIQKEKLKEIETSYKIMGLLKNNLNFDKLIYKKKSDLTLNFTLKQRKYLTHKKEIKMCIDPDWMPYEKILNGKHVGMTSDYISFLENKIGIPIKLVPTTTWNESIVYAQTRKCDIYSLAMATPKRLKYMNFTKPYLDFPIVIATKIDKLFISDIKNVITSKKIGIVEGYAMGEILKKRYPTHKIVDVATVEIGLDLVAQGKIFGFVGALPTVGYELQHKYIGELKIAGKFDDKLALSIGVRNDEPMLLEVFEKAIDTIDLSKKQEILNKYISIKFERGFDYDLFGKIVFFLFIIILLVIYRHVKLLKRNEELKNQRKNLNKINAELLLTKNQVKESLQSFEVLLNSVMEAIFVFEKNICIDVNDVAVEMFGYNSKEEMIGLKIDDFAYKNNLSIVKEKFKDDVSPYEIKAVKKNGDVFDILAKGKNTKLNDKFVRISTIVDTTTIKNQEKLLLQQSKMAAMGEMIDNIAHQWRQPLSLISTISTGIELKLEYNTFKLDEDLESLKKLNHTAQHLSQTINDFRNFFSSNKEKTEFSIKTLIEKNLSLFEGMFKNNWIDVVFVEADDVSIFNYENELTQAFLNIFYNAKDAMLEKKEKKYIFIDLQKEGESVIIKIKDNGGGIKEDILDKIFDPYFTTKHKSQGTGIGLYMTHQIIENNMKGSLQAVNRTYDYENQKFKGAEFIIKLPLI